MVCCQISQKKMNLRGLETLLIVNMNKLLSNVKIYLESYHGKC